MKSYATKLAVPRIPKRDIEELKKTFKKAKKDLDENEVTSFTETDARLYRLLIDNSGNEYLRKMIDKYNGKFVFFRVADLSRIERAKEAYFVHYEIFKAVKEKIALDAKLMAEHIENARTNISRCNIFIQGGNIFVVQR